MIQIAYPYSPALRHIVHSFMEIEYDMRSFPAERFSGKMLPDGSIEVWFVQGDGIALTMPRRPEATQAPGYFVYGQLSSFATLYCTGKLKVFVIRLFPWASRSLFGVPSDELTDRIIDLEILMRNSFIELQDGLETTTSFAEAARAAERFLVKTVHAPLSASELSQAANRIIIQSGGKARIDRLAEHLGVSRQYLNRRFKSDVGLSLKRFCAALRVRICIDNEYAAPAPSFTEVAHRLEYFDQSHFIHEFQRIAGEAPGQFFKRLHFIGGSLERFEAQSAS